MKRVEVFADVSCPFTHVGLRRLVERRAAAPKADVVLRVRAWPLELVNGEAQSGPSVAEMVERLREHAAPDLFVGFDPARFPSTTIPALELAASAYARGDRTGEEVSLAIRTALFEDGLDVSDPDVLGSIARSSSIEVDDEASQAVRSDWREGTERGVVGSPHFFVGERSYFCPALDIRKVDGRLVIAIDAAAFDHFVADVFGAAHRC